MIRNVETDEVSVTFDADYDEMELLEEWLKKRPGVKPYVFENPWRNEWSVGLSTEEYRSYLLAKDKGT